MPNRIISIDEAVHLKPIVHYTDIVGAPKVGCVVFVWPVDHPDTALVSNSTWARTSPVVRVNSEFESEGFETENTQYRFLSTF